MSVEDVESDVSQTRIVQDYKDPNHSWLGHGFKELPYDLPANVHVRRHLKDLPDGVKGLVGWTLDIEVACRGTVKVKVAKSGGMEVWVDGERVAKLPFKARE